MLVASQNKRIGTVGAVTTRCTKWLQGKRLEGAVPAMALVPTAWGVCGVVWDCREEQEGAFAAAPVHSRLCRILTPGLADADLRRELMADFPGCREVLGDGHGHFHPEIVPEWFSVLVRYLQAYYSNGLRDWTQPQFVDNWTYWRPRLEWSLVTPFQRQVLERVAAIPCGLCRTYGELAMELGKPRASRAVGAAVGSNPWPVLVPCHRVVGQGSRLTGFSAPGGVETKRRMLAMEGRREMAD